MRDNLKIPNNMGKGAHGRHRKITGFALLCTKLFTTQLLVELNTENLNKNLFSADYIFVLQLQDIPVNTRIRMINGELGDA